MPATTQDHPRFVGSQRRAFLLSSLRTLGLLLIDYLLSEAIARFSYVCYRGTPDRYGVKEAILFSRRIDEWLRYAAVAHEIQAEYPQGCGIVDVGGIPWGLRGFLPHPRYQITVVNPKLPKWPRSLPTVNVLLADGMTLPFMAGSFEVSVAVDVLEHIPPEKRASAVSELRRAADRSYVVVPIQDRNAGFVARDCDSRLSSSLAKSIGFYDEYLQEHFDFGVPDIEDLRQIGVVPEGGILTALAWESYMPMIRVPLAGFLAGALYLGTWSTYEGPPFYSALCRVLEP